jgi:hypothetical protein
LYRSVKSEQFISGNVCKDSGLLQEAEVCYRNTLAIAARRAAAVASHSDPSLVEPSSLDIGIVVGNLAAVELELGRVSMHVVFFSTRLKIEYGCRSKSRLPLSAEHSACGQPSQIA